MGPRSGVGARSNIAASAGICVSALNAERTTDTAARRSTYRVILRGEFFHIVHFFDALDLVHQIDVRIVTEENFSLGVLGR